MAEYGQAKKIIAANRAKASFAGPRPEELIGKAEGTLGVGFPPTYRKFLLDYGAGNFGSVEFYGVIDADWEDSSVPDGIWYTLGERRQNGMPVELIVVGDTGTGELFVLDTSEEDGPIYAFDPGTGARIWERIASDFGAFFLERIMRQVDF